MARDLQSVIRDRLRLLLPQLNFEIGLVSTTDIDTRETLRQNLRTHLADALRLSGSDRSDVLNLQSRPRQIGAKHVSLSHGAGFGLWGTSDAACGVDLEKDDRVRNAVVARVSSADELKLAPSAVLLWTAKEAAFKCASNHGLLPEVLSQIEIISWQSVGSPEDMGWRFFWRTRDSQQHGSGAATSWNGVSFSFASVSAQLWS